MSCWLGDCIWAACPFSRCNRTLARYRTHLWLHGRSHIHTHPRPIFVHEKYFSFIRRHMSARCKCKFLWLNGPCTHPRPKFVHEKCFSLIRWYMSARCRCRFLWLNDRTLALRGLRRRRRRSDFSLS